MKQFFSLLILLFLSFSLHAQSKKSDDPFQVIVSGSGCPQKLKKTTGLKIESDLVQVPLDYEIALSGANLVRKTCQARITLKASPGFQYEIREVSQSLLFNVQKKSTLRAEISFAVVGLQEFKIDQDVKEAGEFRHILVKKLINYATPCGKDSILRTQTDVQSNGGGNNHFKADALNLTIEKRECSDPVK